MSPACGHLSLFRSKRSVLVSLEVFRDRRRGPARCLLAPLPFRSWCPLVRRPLVPPRPSEPLPGPAPLAGSPPPRGCALPGRLRCPAAPVSPAPSCLPSLVRHGRVPGSRPGALDRQFGLGCRPGPRGRRACPGRPGCGPPGQPANMTLVSVNGSQSRPGPAAKGRTGWRCTVAYRLRSVTSPGKRAGRASRPSLISLRCCQFVTHLKHIPVGRDIIVNMALTCGDAPPGG